LSRGFVESSFSSTIGIHDSKVIEPSKLRQVFSQVETPVFLCVWRVILREKKIFLSTLNPQPSNTIFLSDAKAFVQRLRFWASTREDIKRRIASLKFPSNKERKGSPY
jgi:hypothetical protein